LLTNAFCTVGKPLGFPSYNIAEDRLEMSLESLIPDHRKKILCVRAKSLYYAIKSVDGCEDWIVNHLQLHTVAEYEYLYQQILAESYKQKQ
jgi:hypothetical protein